MNKSTHHQHERKKGNNTEANKFKTGGVKKEEQKKREKKKRGGQLKQVGGWCFQLQRPETPKKTARQATTPHQASENNEYSHKTPDTHT